MARLASSGDRGSRSYSSYSSSYSGSGADSKLETKTYSLEDAINKSGIGELNPMEVYLQMPVLLQEEVDRLSILRFSKKLALVTMTEQREVMLTLYQGLKEAGKHPSKPITVSDVLEMTKQGKIDDIKMYQSLPEELQKYMDAIAKSLNSANFSTANRSIRLQVIESVLKIIAENTKRRKMIEETRLREKQCIMCGGSLGIFNRLFGRKQHQKCGEWKE